MSDSNVSAPTHILDYTDVSELLRALGACKKWIELARGKTAVQLFEEKDLGADEIRWFIKEAGGRYGLPLHADYKAKRATLYADYDAKWATLDDDYKAKCTLLDADYDAKRAPLYDDYKAKCTLLDADYDAKRAPLYDDYEAALKIWLRDYVAKRTAGDHDE